MDKLTVKQWRLIKGLDQREFALAVGMNPWTYRSRETGKRKWTAEELRRIAKFLDVSIDSQINY